VPQGRYVSDASRLRYGAGKAGTKGPRAISRIF
jgi:hypothetical protein